MRNELDGATSTSSTEDIGTASHLPGSATPVPVAARKPLVVKDVLIEEVSIDGMCGVY